MAWLHRHDGSPPTYHVRWRDARGRRHSKSLGPVDAVEAEQERLRTELVEEAREVRRSEVSPPEAVARFLLSLEVQGRRADTRAIHRRRLAPLAEEWAGVPLRRWTRAMLEGWIARHRGWGPRSIALCLGSCRYFVRWCADAGVECADFVGRLRAPRQDAREPVAYSPEEVRRVLACSRGTGAEVAVHLAAYAGLDYGSLRALTWGDVDLDGGWIVRPRPKTGESMRLPVGPALAAVLLPHRGHATALVWDPGSKREAYRALHAVLDAAGVDQAGFHRLRHSYASLLAAEGADVATIGRLLGHRPGSAVTLRYLHSDDARLRAASESVARRLG